MNQAFILDINNDDSFFYSEEYCERNKDNIDNYIIVQQLNDSIIIHDQVELFSVKTQFDKKLKWELTNKFIIQNNVKLFEAITNYKDGKWTVYYNPDIPISKGPFIFAGLPGLVYEIKSDKLNIELLSINYEKNKGCYSVEEEYPIDYKDYEKYNSNYLNTFQESIDFDLKEHSEDLSDTLLKSVKKDLLREFL